MVKKIVIPIIAIVVVVGIVALVYTSTKKTVTNTQTSQQKESNNNESTNSTSNSMNPSTPVENTAKQPLTDLEINDITVGTGATTEKGDVIKVNYTGKLANGVVFDSSYVRNQPFEFQLGSGMVIEGWDKGLMGMKVGGKRSLSIPARMAYGMVERGSIPAGSDLFFEVELVSIKGK